MSEGWKCHCSAAASLQGNAVYVEKCCLHPELPCCKNTVWGSLCRAVSHAFICWASMPWPSYLHLSVCFLEPVPWGDNVLPSNLENTGTQWAQVWQVSCAVTALLLQHFWPCGVNSSSSDSSENSIFMLISVSSLFYRTSPLLIFSSYHLLWPISVIAFLEYCLVSLNR